MFSLCRCSSVSQQNVSNNLNKDSVIQRQKLCSISSFGTCMSAHIQIKNNNYVT